MSITIQRVASKTPIPSSIDLAPTITNDGCGFKGDPVTVLRNEPRRRTWRAISIGGYESIYN
jgi:hypothetical protein